MLKARELAISMALLCGIATAALAQQSGGDATAAGASETPATTTAAQAWAQKYPFLDPDWSSTSFFPREYCRYLIRMDRSDAIYWQIKTWCDNQNQRRIR